jgi:hypothetical protein
MYIISGHQSVALPRLLWLFTGKMEGEVFCNGATDLDRELTSSYVVAYNSSTRPTNC